MAEGVPESGTAFATFDTPLGRCAILWRGDSVVGTLLPEATDARLRAGIAARDGEAEECAPPPVIQAAIEAVVRLLSGETEDLRTVPIALAGIGAFERQVYDAASSIPPGETRTYGEIARTIGLPGSARAVGRALGRNPYPIIVPCHRVLAADGGSGGFSAPGGASTKMKMLEIEGARRGSAPELFDHLPWALKPHRS